jgi:hypothetical protein
MFLNQIWPHHSTPKPFFSLIKASNEFRTSLSGSTLIESSVAFGPKAEPTNTLPSQ